MHVLYVARISRPDIVQRWAKSGIRTTYVAASVLIELLLDSDWPKRLTIDAIGVVVEYPPDKSYAATGDRFEPTDAEHLVRQIRGLSDNVAMPDGRKWCAIPVFVLGVAGTLAGQGFFAFGEDPKSVDAEFLPLDAISDYGTDAIIRGITDYRQRVLAELDNLGFVVTYEAGCYRLGPALRPRAELAGHYYFSPADRRGDHVVTIDRDMLGIQLEIEEFEALINRPNVREQELQAFLSERPYFLSLSAQPLSHIRLQDQSGKLLIPDLILKPLVAARRDSNWEVLELKLPVARLTAGKGARRRLSHDVWKAITQLREYGSYFADPRNEARVHAALGHTLKRPRLAVLIGRGTDAEIDAVESQQAYLSNVRIVTYDEILEQQRVLLR